MEDTILKAQAITKSFISGNERLDVLMNIDLEVKSGEWLCIVGPSGSGKSTLLHILGGLDNADSGSVTLNHSNFTSIKTDEVSHIRNRDIGFVFQFHHLLPEFNVIENVAMPLLINGTSRDDSFKQADNILKEIGFSERGKSRPSELSGGEKQRVALARALVINPLIILADEPTGNLDAANTDILLHILQKLNQEKKTTILTVTHNPNVVEFASRKLILKNGKLLAVEG
jgi:lipoprotein-releasing system ATP-binding protein